MSELTTAPVEAPPASPGVGRIIAGILIIVIWELVHVVLFYLIFASGLLIQLFLGMLRSILFPGDTRSINLQDDWFGWTGLLVVGLSIVGAAGVALGLRLFWQSRRRVLLRIFWWTLLTGFLFELGALYSLIKTSFS